MTKRSSTHAAARRAALRLPFALAAAGALAGCGFKLRGVPNFAFESIAIGGVANSPVAAELKTQLLSGGNVRVLDDPAQAQVVLDLTGDQREKGVVGLGVSGQVREFQLRLRLKFRLRTPQGRTLIEETELLQQRDISFNEAAALSKESEEQLLYRAMQTDLVRQLMRRLAAVKTL